MVLPEGSFFGELPVMLNIFCQFTLKTAPKKSGKKQMLRQGHHMVLIYELESDVFRGIMTDYPQYASNIYVRAELRTAYFKYLTALR